MRWVVASVVFLVSTVAFAQQTNLQADFRREEKHVGEACGSFGLKLITGCAYELFTDHPLHIAAGSMPPQNGFGLGGAFVWDENTTNWRLSWDVDAVGATSGAWRAGGYMKMVHTPRESARQVFSTSGSDSPASPKKKSKEVNLTHTYTVFNLYAQTISLNKLSFFGLGNDTTLAGASVFGMTETVFGGRVIKPVFEWTAIRKLNLSLLGEINGRFVTIRGERGESVPSIEQLYTNVTAPGLSNQPGFIQGGEGVRIKPVIGYFHLNYIAKFE